VTLIVATDERTPESVAGSGPGAVRPVLELVGVSAGYGDLAAVRDVSLHVSAGEVVALFGPNGAGKTTTLLAGVGVLPRTSGAVRWRGRPAAKSLHAMTRAGLAFVPEERSVISGLSTRDNLRLGRGTVEDALVHFPELADLLDRKAGLLSGGEQQMLTLARALASRPAVLVVDELSLGLAPIVVDRLLGAIRQAADQYGLAVLVVEQEARRALATADRWYLLRNGAVVAEGDAGTGGGTLEAAYLASMSTVPPSTEASPPEPHEH
jgi:branched-chain amino acid transport system ATP-binding protein